MVLGAEAMQVLKEDAAALGSCAISPTPASRAQLNLCLFQDSEHCGLRDISSSGNGARAKTRLVQLHDLATTDRGQTLSDRNSRRPFVQSFRFDKGVGFRRRQDNSDRRRPGRRPGLLLSAVRRQAGPRCEGPRAPRCGVWGSSRGAPQPTKKSRPSRDGRRRYSDPGAANSPHFDGPSFWG